ncbi:hypothetical protein ON010_g8195 [Phytophthora cinnamomi]|nr:hypothetical protein ON010_g8195 [Phytophthora cinnamomi]
MRVAPSSAAFDWCRKPRRHLSALTRWKQWVSPPSAMARGGAATALHRDRKGRQQGRAAHRAAQLRAGTESTARTQRSVTGRGHQQQLQLPPQRQWNQERCAAAQHADALPLPSGRLPAGAGPAPRGQGHRRRRLQAEQDPRGAQVDRPRADGLQPEPEGQAPRRPGQQEARAPGPAPQADARHPPPALQAREVAQDLQAAEEGVVLPQAPLRSQGVSC